MEQAMKAKDLTQARGSRPIGASRQSRAAPSLQERPLAVGLYRRRDHLFCSPEQEFTVLRDECKSRLEEAALKLAANRIALRQRLQEARSCLCREVAKEFGKGRFDFTGRRLIGGNGLVLQWQTRMDPDRPETYVNQQTSRGW